MNEKDILEELSAVCKILTFLKTRTSNEDYLLAIEKSLIELENIIIVKIVESSKTYLQEIHAYEN